MPDFNQMLSLLRGGGGGNSYQNISGSPSLTGAQPSQGPTSAPSSALPAPTPPPPPTSQNQIPVQQQGPLATPPWAMQSQIPYQQMMQNLPRIPWTGGGWWGQPRT